ncbi:Testis intracellular mediator protein, partial [Zea mays]
MPLPLTTMRSPPLPNHKFFDKSWRKLHDAIREIYNHNCTGLSFEELYRYFEALVFINILLKFVVLVLATDTVHYNPFDLSSWVESMLSELNAPPSPLPPVTPAPRLASTMIARRCFYSTKIILSTFFVETPKMIKKSKDLDAIGEMKSRVTWIDKQLTSHPPKNIESKILREHIKKEREAAKAGKRSYYLKKSELCERKLVNKYNELKVKSTRFKGMLVNIDTNNGDPQV